MLKLEVLMELTLILSLMCAALLCSHTLLLRKLGAHYTYSLWAVIPMVLIIEVVQWLFPSFYHQLTSNLLSQNMQQFTVIASDSLSMPLSSLFLAYFPYVYAVGVVVLLLNLAQQYRQLHHIKTQSIALDITSLTDDASVNQLTICQSEQVHSPMLMGLWRARIVVPSSFIELSHQQQQAILAHEYYHYHRKDMWANGLAYAITVLMWFNPLLWLAYKRFRHDQELSCDAAVTASMATDSKIAYSRALLAYSQHAPLSMLHTHYGDKTILKERILQMKKQHGKSTLMLLGLTLALGVSAVTINPVVQAGDKQVKGDAIYPTMRVEPKYPLQAAEQGLNGYVQMSFDVNPVGNVSNVKVIKSSPQGVFDASAVEALTQWQYQASTHGQQGALVQLDFVIHQPDESIERIQVH